VGSRRQTYTQTTKVAADGTASVTFTARGSVLHVEHVRLTVSTTVKKPTAVLYLNGVNFEGTGSGYSDQSDTHFDMSGGDILTCAWTGGDVNARATMYVRGVQED
jgi:hypothetical protein